MPTIWAIVLISMRNAVRSKIVLVLLFFLLVALIGLPLSVRGDGTISGHVQLLLRYTLGVAMLILSIATVWAACAAVSTEIRDRHIQMVLSKPVRATQLWLGKWLGVTLLNGGLLLLCVVVTYGALRWTTRPAVLSAEEQELLATEILVAQRRVDPQLRDLRADIAREYEAARARGEWPAETPTHQVWPLVERTVRARANAVQSGGQNRWVFQLPRQPPPDRPLILRYRFALSILDMETIRGRWRIGPPGDPRRYEVEVFDAPRSWNSIAIPPEWVADDRTLTVEFANVHERPVMVLFNPADGLRLMVYEGGFLANLLRAGLSLFFHLAFLSAIGVTAGTFFSIPVAALASFYALLLLNTGRFVQRLAGRGGASIASADAGWIEQMLVAITQGIYRALDLILGPVYTANPLDLIAVGEWVGWGEISYQFLVKVFLYGGVLMGCGVWHLSRKEVALPL